MRLYKNTKTIYILLSVFTFTTGPHLATSGPVGHPERGYGLQTQPSITLSSPLVTLGY